MEGIAAVNPNPVVATVTGGSVVASPRILTGGGSLAALVSGGHLPHQKEKYTFHLRMPSNHGRLFMDLYFFPIYLSCPSSLRDGRRVLRAAHGRIPVFF
jgi:hypothetical protein